jgi:hypothetical protein
MLEDCTYKKICYAMAFVVVLIVLLMALGYVRVAFSSTGEWFTNQQITDALVYKVLSEDPQNSAAVMRSLSPQERQKYTERFEGLPYDPRYYAKSS